jgi:RNA polymerase sigma-70 factor (ECF subfamily)
LASKDDAARVRLAIESIADPFREAIIMRDLEDLSYAEIAQVMGVPIGTVMSRLARGRAMLARQLLPQMGSEDNSTRSMN